MVEMTTYHSFITRKYISEGNRIYYEHFIGIRECFKGTMFTQFSISREPRKYLTKMRAVKILIKMLLLEKSIFYLGLPIGFPNY